MDDASVEAEEEIAGEVKMKAQASYIYSKY
jgi:hypothetical protein